MVDDLRRVVDDGFVRRIARATAFVGALRRIRARAVGGLFRRRGGAAVCGRGRLVRRRRVGVGLVQQDDVFPALDRIHQSVGGARRLKVGIAQRIVARAHGARQMRRIHGVGIGQAHAIGVDRIAAVRFLLIRIEVFEAVDAVALARRIAQARIGSRLRDGRPRREPLVGLPGARSVGDIALERHRDAVDARVLRVGSAGDQAVLFILHAVAVGVVPHQALDRAFALGHLAHVARALARGAVGVEMDRQRVVERPFVFGVFGHEERIAAFVGGGAGIGVDLARQHDAVVRAHRRFGVGRIEAFLLVQGEHAALARQRLAVARVVARRGVGVVGGRIHRHAHVVEVGRVIARQQVAVLQVDQGRAVRRQVRLARGGVGVARRQVVEEVHAVEVGFRHDRARAVGGRVARRDAVVVIRGEIVFAEVAVLDPARRSAVARRHEIPLRQTHLLIGNALVDKRLVQAVVAILRVGAAFRRAVVEHPAGKRRLGHGRKARVPRQVGQPRGGVVHRAVRAFDHRVGGRVFVGALGDRDAFVGQIARAHVRVMRRGVGDARIRPGSVDVGVDLVVASGVSVRDDPRMARIDAVAHQVVVVDAHLEAAQMRCAVAVHVGRAGLEDVDARIRGLDGAHGLVGIELPGAGAFRGVFVPPVLLERHLDARDAGLVELAHAVAVRVFKHRIADEAFGGIHEAERERVTHRVARRAIAVGRIDRPVHAALLRGGLDRRLRVKRRRGEFAVQRGYVVVGLAGKRIVRMQVRRRLEEPAASRIGVVAFVEVFRLGDVRARCGHGERERPVVARHGLGRRAVGIEGDLGVHRVGRGVVFMHAHAHVRQARLVGARFAFGIGALLVDPSVDGLGRKRSVGPGLRKHIVAPGQAAETHRQGDAHVVRCGRIVVCVLIGLVERLHLERLGHRDKLRARAVVGRNAAGLHAHRRGAFFEARPRLELRQRVVAILLGEGVAQAVFRRRGGAGALLRAGGGQIREHEIAGIAVVVLLGRVDVGAARRGHDIASLVVEQRIARDGVALHPQALARLADALDELHSLAVAVDGLLVFVEQLDFHPVDAGVVGHAVVIEVDELLAAREALARGRVDARQQAAAVGACAVVVGAVGGVVGHAVPVGVVPHVVADIAAAGRRVHIGAGLAVLADMQHLAAVFVAHLAQEGVPLHLARPRAARVGGCGRALVVLLRSKLGGGSGFVEASGRIRIGSALGNVAREHRQIQRRTHLIHELDASRCRGFDRAFRLRPDGAHAFEQRLFALGMRGRIRLHLGQAHEVLALENRGVGIACGHPFFDGLLVFQAVRRRKAVHAEGHEAALAVACERTDPDVAAVLVEHVVTLGIDSVGGRVGPQLDIVEAFQPAVPLRIARDALACRRRRHAGVALVGKHVVDDGALVEPGASCVVAVRQTRLVFVVRAFGNGNRASERAVVIRGQIARRHLGLLDRRIVFERQRFELDVEQRLVDVAVEVGVACIGNPTHDAVHGILNLGHIRAEAPVFVDVSNAVEQARVHRRRTLACTYGHHDIQNHGLPGHQNAREVPCHIFAVLQKVRAQLVFLRDVAADERIVHAHAVGAERLALLFDVIGPHDLRFIEIRRRRAVFALAGAVRRVERMALIHFGPRHVIELGRLGRQILHEREHDGHIGVRRRVHVVFDAHFGQPVGRHIGQAKLVFHHERIVRIDLEIARPAVAAVARPLEICLAQADFEIRLLGVAVEARARTLGTRELRIVETG